MLIIPLQIYQVVRKLADEQAQLENGKRLTVSTVYDSIKHSNSSLKRRSKKLLEDSIDRVLLVFRNELNDSDSLDDDSEGLEEDITPQLKVGLLICRGQLLLTVPRKIIL